MRIKKIVPRRSTDRYQRPAECSGGYIRQQSRKNRWTRLAYRARSCPNISSHSHWQTACQISIAAICISYMLVQTEHSYGQPPGCWFGNEASSSPPWAQQPNRVKVENRGWNWKCAKGPRQLMRAVGYTTKPRFAAHKNVCISQKTLENINPRESAAANETASNWRPVLDSGELTMLNSTPDRAEWANMERLGNAFNLWPAD